MYYTKFKSKYCSIVIVGDNDGITDLYLDTGEGKREIKIEPSWSENTDLFEEAKKQIDEFFKKERSKFNLKLNMRGTEFQKRVWNALIKIPYGELCSYKEVALLIGNKNASRAVGMANSKNPIPLIIPCHRVVGKNGNLTGFAHGIFIKEKLINFEKKNFNFA